MPLVHQVVGTWLKFLTISMVTLDEKVLLLWCVTYINKTFCDTKYIYIYIYETCELIEAIHNNRPCKISLFFSWWGGLKWDLGL